MRKLIDWFKRKQNTIFLYFGILLVWALLNAFIEQYKQDRKYKEMEFKRDSMDYELKKQDYELFKQQ
jgi:predicted histidine transporter YuiF (NhaC family)